jgi:hypothetical protein
MIKNHLWPLISLFFFDSVMIFQTLSDYSQAILNTCNGLLFWRFTRNESAHSFDSGCQFGHKEVVIRAESRQYILDVVRSRSRGASGYGRSKIVESWKQLEVLGPDMECQASPEPIQRLKSRDDI